MRLSDWHHSLQATLYDLVRNCHHRKKVCSVKSCEMDLQNIYFLVQPYIIRRLRARRDKKRRLCWINEILSRRNLLGEFHHLHDDLLNDPQKFFDYYRMSLDTFQYILSAIESSIAKDSNFRETIRPVERLSVTLRYLATGASFKTLGYSFRMSDVTVGRIVKETCIAIWDQLSTLHMPFPPTDEQQESIKEGFWRKWKFPSYVGCIDGKHIRIRNPDHSGSMFRNYKHFFSTVLQGVAGPDYKFITIDTGGYGKESEGGVFSNSRLHRRLENNEFCNKRLTTLPGSNIKVPCMLLGDEAYPVKTYLMRPFPASQLGPEHTIFNKRLSQARQVIECAFGIISAKWRVLQKGIEVEPNFVDDIVKCVCLLHNIIIDKEGEPQPMSIPQQSETSTTRARFASLGENRSVTTAYVIRDKFAAYFCEHQANT
ncbi:unnamed protein product [Acanthoscelides obtectus]|uniref:DDE Tnp4 domain-containing protein n=1 Tax=Acanthoscelides obtectus TaxID=200917 RepID=A0A9P0Q619_ACAOB|nr:unnamed protein product [Acanthoscelides obtectus]CAK1651096.1 Protein ALP1-like [Acanthoscelides obtectus]